MSALDLTDSDVFTADEAAKILRISRGAAYDLARQWRTTGGEHGLPCIQLGHTLRVPRAALQDLLDTGGQPHDHAS